MNILNKNIVPYLVEVYDSFTNKVDEVLVRAYSRKEAYLSVMNIMKQHKGWDATEVEFYDLSEGQSQSIELILTQETKCLWEYDGERFEPNISPDNSPYKYWNNNVVMSRIKHLVKLVADYKYIEFVDADSEGGGYEGNWKSNNYQVIIYQESK